MAAKMKDGRLVLRADELKVGDDVSLYYGQPTGTVIVHSVIGGEIIKRIRLKRHGKVDEIARTHPVDSIFFVKR